MSDGSLTYLDRLTQWLRGNQSAIEFIDKLTTCLHCWDDLIDRDQAVSPDVLHRTFWDLCIALPRNAFYMQNFSILNGVLQQAILNWHIANEMELSGDDLDAHIAFILRSSYIDLVTSSAWIIGGERWAIQVGREARRLTSSEGFDLYRTRLAREQREDVHHG